MPSVISVSFTLNKKFNLSNYNYEIYVIWMYARNINRIIYMNINNIYELTIVLLELKLIQPLHIYRQYFFYLHFLEILKMICFVFQDI